MGSMARALLPRTRRRGRSLIVGKVAAATSDLDVFFIAASKNLDVFVERSGNHCAAVTGRSDQGPTARPPYLEWSRSPWRNSPSLLPPAVVRRRHGLARAEKRF